MARKSSTAPAPPPPDSPHPVEDLVLPSSEEGEGHRRSRGLGGIGAAVGLGALAFYFLAYPPIIITLEELDVLDGGEIIVEKTIVPLVYLYENAAPYKAYIEWLTRVIDF